MKNFRDLLVWEKAHQLTMRIYEATSTYPADERFGLVSQIRRSASSVPTNIAEGCGRHSDKDFARFLQISMGSASELEYQLLLSHDLHYLQTEPYDEMTNAVQEVKRMLTSLIKKLKADS